ncbi:unnamed protein product, partial [Scytosiphon promiscuus]
MENATNTVRRAFIEVKSITRETVGWTSPFVSSSLGVRSHRQTSGQCCFNCIEVSTASDPLGLCKRRVSHGEHSSGSKCCKALHSMWHYLVSARILSELWSLTLTTTPAQSICQSPNIQAHTVWHACHQKWTACCLSGTSGLHSRQKFTLLLMTLVCVFRSTFSLD